MGKLIFRNHDQEKIAASVEEMLRQETGSTKPVAYTIEDSRDTNAGTVMGEILHATFGGERSAIQLFRMHFMLTQPRVGQLWVQINKQGIGSYAGSLLYMLELNKPVASEVGLEPDKDAAFRGDPAISAKLGTELAKRTNKLLRSRIQVGASTVSTHPFLRILPQGNTSTLVINTLPRSTSLGFGSTLDAKEALDIASVIESTL